MSRSRRRSFPFWRPDGRSLVPLLQGQSPSVWRQAVLLEQMRGPVSPLAPVLRDRQFEPPDTADLATGGNYPGHNGYRSASYKYVEYDTGERELYFLGPDPDEMENRAAAASPIFLAAASTYLSGLTASGCASSSRPSAGTSAAGPTSTRST